MEGEYRIKVNVHNEWDRLDAVVVGVPDYSCMPGMEFAVKVWLGCCPGDEGSHVPGPRSKEKCAAAQRELDNFVRILKDRNVTVVKPDIGEWSLNPVTTPWWSSQYIFGVACPRDTLNVVGNEIIEAGMASRCRFFEYAAYRNVIERCLSDDPDCKWTAAPKPILSDASYDLDYPCEENSERRKAMIAESKFPGKESDIFFEAADMTRFGKDIFVQHGFTTNLRGIDWLRRNLSPAGYRVHSLTFPGDLCPIHIDATFGPILAPSKERKGIIWNNMERLLHPSKKGLFEPSFEIREAPEAAHESGTLDSMCSKWLSMNMLHLDPHTIVVEETEKPTIRALESLGIKVIPCAFRNCYEFGGSFHCHTSCLSREGTRENYFPHLD